MNTSATNSELSLTGVYVIRNTVNGKVYVGSASVKFRTRWRQHLYYLRRGTHHSVSLQRAWNKYGEASFCFEIVVQCAPSLCIQTEQEVIDQLRASTSEHGYNILPTAGSPLGVKRRPEVLKQMSETMRYRYANPKERELQSERMKKACNTTAFKKKMSASQKLYNANPSVRDRKSRELRKRYENPEEREKTAANVRLRYSNPGERLKTSTAMLKYCEQPEARRRMSARNRARYAKQSERDKTADAMRAVWADPEKRSKRLLAMAAARANKVTRNTASEEA